MTEGWVYCFSNPSMPGLLKIGMTRRTPHERLKEANSSDTWRPPTYFVIEFAKKVHDPLQKEKTIHALLQQYEQRVNPKREFFKVSTAIARHYFELMDGEWLQHHPSNAALPVANTLPAAIGALPIRGLAKAEAECLFSIVLDNQRIQLLINGTTYPYHAFDKVQPTWLHQKTGEVQMWREDVNRYVSIVATNINEVLMELSQENTSYLLVEVR